MAHRKQVKSTGVNHDFTKARKITELISFEDLIEKEVQSSLEDGAICELSVLADPANEDSTRIKQKIRILDHPKNLVDFLRARFAIGQGLTSNNTTRECKDLRARTKYKHKYSKWDYKRNYREVDL